MSDEWNIKDHCEKGKAIWGISYFHLSPANYAFNWIKFLKKIA